MLYLEWQFSPQGLAIFDEFIGKGVPFPGSGTRVSKALEGVPLIDLLLPFLYIQLIPKQVLSSPGKAWGIQSVEKPT